MPTPQDLIQRYPEFKADFDDDRVGFFIEDAKVEISQKHWGRLYQRGVLALAAHLMRLNQWSAQSGGGAIKSLASESAGELSVSYALPPLSGTESDYQLTAYGQEYLRLRKLVGVGLMVV